MINYTLICDFEEVAFSDEAVFCKFVPGISKVKQSI